MKKVCYISTVSKSIEWFMLENAKYLMNEGFEVFFICNADKEFLNKIPIGITLIDIPMKRGITLSGLKMIFIFYKDFKWTGPENCQPDGLESI